MNPAGIILILASMRCGETFSVYFQNAQFPHPALKWIGSDRFVRKEAGLRVTLPADRELPEQVGFSPHFSVSGNFEITFGYQILSAEKPKTGYGVGVNINLIVGSPMRESAVLARYTRVMEGDVYFVSRTSVLDGNTRSQAKTFPSNVKQGKLRLQRTGSMLHWFVAEDLADRFREIHEAEFVNDDLDQVRVMANTGGSPAALDMRFLDLNIESGNLPNKPPLKDDSPAGTGPLLIAGVISVVALAVISLYWRLRKSPEGYS